MLELREKIATNDKTLSPIIFPSPNACTYILFMYMYIYIHTCIHMNLYMSVVVEVHMENVQTVQ